MKIGEVYIKNFNEFIEGKTNYFSLYELINIGEEEKDPISLFGERRLITFKNIDTNEIIHMFDIECCGQLEVFTSSMEKRLYSEYKKLQERLESINSLGINFN